MERHFSILLAVILTTAASALIGGVAHAAESIAVDGPSFDLKRWEKTLRRAGASPAEIAKFDDMVKDQSPNDLPSFEDYLRSTPPSTMTQTLRSIVRNEQESAPPALLPTSAPMMPCESLRGLPLPETTIDSAVPAPDGSCRVTATVVHSPADNPIKVFIALPMRGWNGRFRGTGGGGYSGGSASNLDGPVSKDYAVGATDTGNPAGTANFALDAHGKQAWNRLRNNAYRGIHDMTVVGKALTQAFYGRAARYAYFVAESTGGRQALTEAQRYPDDYDGILALYPAIARDRYVPAQLWPQVLMHEAGDYLPRAKLDAATAAAVKACGGPDGIIANPTQCSYDPTELVGRAVGDSTFTPQDTEVIRGIWEGPRDHDGGFLWWGPTRGTDLSILADTVGTPLQGKPFGEGLDWFRYFLVLDPKWDWQTLTRTNFELLFAQSIHVHASTYGGDDPDLTAFRSRGGKLLMVHGWADQLVPAQESIAYYRQVQRRMGGAERTADFLRLFLVPGADHGFSGPVPAPSIGAMISALMQWVETGRAPDQLNAERLGARNKIIKLRTLLPYRVERLDTGP